MFDPLFAGKLVRLAAPQPEDRSLLAAWSRDDEYMRLLDDDPVRPLSESAYGFLDNASSHDSTYFHIRTLAGGRMIGFCVLHSIKWASQSAELAIGIGDSDYRGSGCGTDALRVLLNYAFDELNLYRVGLTVLAYNSRAIRVYERLGFVREGAKRDAVQRAGKRYDLVLYGILRSEWQAARHQP